MLANPTGAQPWLFASASRGCCWLSEGPGPGPCCREGRGGRGSCETGAPPGPLSAWICRLWLPRALISLPNGQANLHTSRFPFLERRHLGCWPLSQPRGARAPGLRQAEAREPLEGGGLAGAGRQVGEVCAGVRGSHTAQGAGEDWTPPPPGARGLHWQRPRALPVPCPGPPASDSNPLLTKPLGTKFPAGEARPGGGGISADHPKKGCSNRVRALPWFGEGVSKGGLRGAHASRALRGPELGGSAPKTVGV